MGVTGSIASTAVEAVPAPPQDVADHLHKLTLTPPDKVVPAWAQQILDGQRQMSDSLRQMSDSLQQMLEGLPQTSQLERQAAMMQQLQISQAG
jgi:hypothetical protein